jgi:hypothetical protein
MSYPRFGAWPFRLACQAAVLACAPAGNAFAAPLRDELVQTVAFPLQFTNWTADATFLKFNPLLGVLTSVQIEFASRVEVTFGIENTLPFEVTVGTQVSAPGSLTIPGLSTAILVQPETPIQLIELNPFDGTVDFAGPSGFSYTRGAEATTIQVLPPPFEALAAFTGPVSAPESIRLTCEVRGNSQVTGTGGEASFTSQTAGASITLRYTFTPSDCNQNGIADGIDVSSGASVDCDANGLPDECEFDFDLDGAPDACDPDCYAAQGSTLPDADGDGLVDPCDRLDDCDADGVPDLYQDDGNSNGVLDSCEFTDDCNQNGLPDAFDIALGTSVDLDDNDVPDECAGAAQGFFGDCACAAHVLCVGAPNSAGPGAHLGISGTCSVWRDDLILHVFAAPPGRVGCFVLGDAALPAPFGAGRICVGGNLRRFPPVVTSAQGTAALDLPLLESASWPAPILPGETRHVQFLYRDAWAGAGRNASDSVYVVFCP